ncbi:MAG: hypothetical protein M1831_003397 [Alyxoria varia]|nr:MAG: hypothetical protein M1831_003397 [Alyxoria varia]
MNDSFHKVVLPLAQDPWLSDVYLNSSGHIRLGTVLMDLDALSGIVAYKHTGEGVTTVTAALDRVSIENPLDETCDLEYSGHVTYATGRSSMEITCQVAKAPKDGSMSQQQDVLINCTFTMVSLDPETKKSVNIPSLETTGPLEEAMFKLGESRSVAKKAMASFSLHSHEPNDAESALIHRMWLLQVAYRDSNNSKSKPENVQPMANTVLRTANIMQPQYRNRHQFQIFGGFLLKQTFELAFCCAASFSHARPTFICADPCTFLNPVPVGSVLYLSATVAYTDPSFVHDEDGISGPAATGDDVNEPMTRVSIRVDSKVRDVEHGTTKPTGQFHYTFMVKSNMRVMPQSYQENMIYLDGKRRSMRADMEMNDFMKPNIVADTNLDCRLTGVS